MKKLIAAVCSLSLALATTLPAQQPAVQPATTRLVYELPIDAMQRSLRADHNNTMEALLARAIDTAAIRLQAMAQVTRLGAATFAVDVASNQPEDIASARNLIESAGTLEFRMVARSDYAKADLQLQRERDHLEKWLKHGGRQALQHDLMAIADFKRIDPTKVQWAPHRIKIRPNTPGHRLSQSQATMDASVPLFSADEWQKAQQAAAQNNQETYLVELVAINMHESSFSQGDLNPKETKVSNDQQGHIGIDYAMAGEHQSRFADWSQQHINEAQAILANGELVSAPVFRSKIVGRGRIEGGFDEREAKALVQALLASPSPVQPRFVRQESLPSNPDSPATSGK